MDPVSILQTILASYEFTSLLLTAFAGIATAVIGVIGYQFRKKVLHGLSATDYALLREVAMTSVQYAEQKFKGADGPTKLAESVKAANTILASYGLTVTIEQLTKVIEAAVYAEIAKQPLPEPVIDPSVGTDVAGPFTLS